MKRELGLPSGLWPAVLPQESTPADVSDEHEMDRDERDVSVKIPSVMEPASEQHSSETRSEGEGGGVLD